MIKTFLRTSGLSGYKPKAVPCVKPDQLYYQGQELSSRATHVTRGRANGGAEGVYKQKAG